MDEKLEGAGIGAEGHATFMHIGAGNVQFVSRDAFGVVEALDDADVFRNGIAEDVDDDFAFGISRQWRQFALDEFFYADVLKPDRVEHPAAV